MSYLPPELEALERSYSELYNRVQNGELDPDAAMATLEAMTAVDGAGVIWRVNPSAEGFLCAQPGGYWEPGRVEQWQPLSHPNPDYGTDPYAGFVPPTDPGPGSMWATSPGAGPAAFPNAEPLPQWVPSPAPAPRRDPLAPLRAVAGTVTGLLGTGRRRNYLIVGIVCALLVGYAALAGGPAGTSPAPTPAPTGAPSPSVALPSAKQADAVLATLVSGDRTKIAALLVTPGDAAEVALRAAQWAGFAKAGLKPVAQAPAVVGNTAVQLVEIVDTATNKPVLAMTLTYVIDNGRVRLAAWPDPRRL